MFSHKTLGNLFEVLTWVFSVWKSWPDSKNGDKNIKDGSPQFNMAVVYGVYDLKPCNIGPHLCEEVILASHWAKSIKSKEAFNKVRIGKLGLTYAEILSFQVLPLGGAESVQLINPLVYSKSKLRVRGTIPGRSRSVSFWKFSWFWAKSISDKNKLWKLKLCKLTSVQLWKLLPNF